MQEILVRLRAKAAKGVSCKRKDLEAVCDEVERLQAVIDKQPKTADEVPVVPGVDWVWRWQHIGGDVFEWVQERASAAHHLVKKCFSTLEAAQAAREE